jgi:hypothetical protein
MGERWPQLLAKIKGGEGSRLTLSYLLCLIKVAYSVPNPLPSDLPFADVGLRELNAKLKQRWGTGFTVSRPTLGCWPRIR